jgi:hypothetical protein
VSNLEHFAPEEGEAHLPPFFTLIKTELWMFRDRADGEPSAIGRRSDEPDMTSNKSASIGVASELLRPHAKEHSWGSKRRIRR